MSLSVVAFLVLVLAFAWGSLTPVNAGLIAIVAAYAVGVLLAGFSVAQVTALFPANLFFILLGATLLFSIVRVTGTIDLLAAWAERLARGKRLRIPVLMFALTAFLATVGAFTPAAVAIVAPVALALGARFGISELAMGLVIVQGANAGAFSPVNPFGVIANRMLDQANASGGSLLLYLYCFLFNVVVAAIAYGLVQWWVARSAGVAPAPVALGAAVAEGGRAEPPAAPPAPAGGGPVELDAMRVLTLLGVLSLLVLTLGFGLDVGVAALFASLVLVAFRPAIQKPALQGVAWSAILLVTGIVTYVGVLEKMGAITELQSGIATLGGSAIATLVTCYVVGFVSAFASTTGTLGAILPLVVPLATDPALTPVGVVTAISIASSVVDVSPMSTSGALLMASAEPKDEALFFRALLVYAITMIGIVPLVVWLVFVRSGLF
jgi:Na+/H+ antiporter NhaD/arsenite permease-like protein